VLPVEIVSVDSALVYRDMDIGTAKPSRDELAACPHHLIDIVTPEEAYSAALFCADARRLMGEITARGRIPLLVGGTMLYYKALREGLSELPEADASLRREIEDAAARDGWPALHAELARLDPAAAARLQPRDAQRIQRALEIVRLTGQPLAASYARRAAAADTHRYLPIALCPGDRAVLHARIERRFDTMLLAGFVDEVAALREKYHLTPELPSMRCVGYRQALEYLDGEVSLATFRDKGIFATRQLAKRQLTWQRNFRDNWADLAEVDSLAPDAEGQVRALVEAGLG
jgi:tRNA dimethylallyltransferase